MQDTDDQESGPQPDALSANLPTNGTRSAADRSAAGDGNAMSVKFTDRGTLRIGEFVSVPIEPVQRDETPVTDTDALTDDDADALTDDDATSTGDDFFDADTFFGGRGHDTDDAPSGVSDEPTADAKVEIVSATSVDDDSSAVSGAVGSTGDIEHLQAEFATAVAELRTEIATTRSMCEAALARIESEITRLGPEETLEHRAWTVRQARLAARQIDLIYERLDDRADNLPGRISERLDSAIGEATTTRIELERLTENIEERYDTFAVRLADVESALQEQGVDVNLASQTERLEELERAIETFASSGAGAVLSEARGRLDDVQTDDGASQAHQTSHDISGGTGNRTTNDAAVADTAARDAASSPSPAVVEADPLSRLAQSLAEADREDASAAPDDHAGDDPSVDTSEELLVGDVIDLGGDDEAVA